MKKLMVAAAIVCAAVVSQAATVKWSSSFNAIDKEGNILHADPKPLTVSLVLLGTGVTDLGTFEADWSKAVAVQDATWAIKENTKAKPPTWTAKASGTYYGDDKHTIAIGDVYAVMLNDNGTLSQLTYADGTLVNEMVLVEKAGASDQTTFGTFATANYVVESVPEPTSAMLLLLGVAGLALKRKRA